MRIRFCAETVLLFVLFAVGAAPVLAAADSGMVTAVQGHPTYASGQASPQPIVNFMKLRSSDKIELGKGDTIQIVYFDGGTQEAWRGPATLTVDESGSKADKDAASPAIRLLPSVVLQNLKRAPGMIADIKNRSGMIMVRAAPSPKKLKEIDATYANLRKEALAGDITPELYLLGAYGELNLNGEIKGVLDEMRRRQPGDPEVEAIASHYEKISGK